MANNGFGDISFIGREMLRYFPKKKVMEVNTLSSSDDRLYSYCEILNHVGAECFRSMRGVVYWHDGSVWRAFDGNGALFELAVKDAMSRVGVPKRDITKSLSKMAYAVRQGAFLSPLGVNPSCVGFENGVWDFSDFSHPVRHSFSEKVAVTSLLPYRYDPDAGCPVWKAFLDSVLTEPQQLVLQKFLGLGCCSRSDIGKRIEETLWLVGNGGNGKSVIFEVVKGVFGAGNMSFLPLDHLVTPNIDLRMRNMAKIEHKVFNYCSEIQASDITRYSDTFKSLCSGEPQEARAIQRDSWTASDLPYFIFNMNRMPSNGAMDRAFTRRLLIIDFDTSVRAEDMDRGLVGKLMKELPGIRNWCLRGLERLVADDWAFTSTSLNSEAIRAYEIENGQTVKLFCDDKEYRAKKYSGRWDEKPYYVESSLMYQMYVSYCGQNGIEPVTSNKFGRDMTQLKYGREKFSGTAYYRVFSEKPIDGGYKAR